MSYAKRKFRKKPSIQFLRDWVAALESGEYRKGMGHLCIAHQKKDGSPGVEKFCCLGVAADLNGDLGEMIHYPPVPNLTAGCYIRQDRSGSDGSLPEGLYGLSMTVIDKLIDLNDDATYSGWRRVIAYIKETYPYAFEENA